MKGLRMKGYSLSGRSLFLTLFLSGFAAGVLYITLFGKAAAHETTLMSAYFFSKYQQVEFASEELFWYTLKARMSVFTILWLTGLTVLGTAAVCVFLFWIGAALAAAYAFTGKKHYREAACKAAGFYHRFVRELNVCGTPMDTWKAPDQEGNLAFMKLVRLLHETTGEASLLEMLEDGAHYEYLWRYGFRAVPEIMPLAGSSWNSCGGSVTSVSNPHIHPMGVLITPELYYLAERTGNELHRMRAEDGMAWSMNCLELYPEITGYGRYGVTTERFCPSDGLTDFYYSDGRPSSLWYSYNGWAAANILEALLWMTEHTKG